MNRDAWYQRMPGLLLMAEEKAVLDRILSTVRGMILVQIGGPFETAFTERANVQRLCYLDAHCRAYASKPLIQADPSQLPIQSESIDLVLLMHILEGTQNPEIVLEEVHRILKPNGKIMLLCFNAFGVWQIRHLLSSRLHFPWNGTYYSMGTIKRLLRKLNCHIDFQQTLCFRPPLHHAHTAEKWAFLEAFGQLCLPYCGAVFALVATKNEPGMTPLVLKNWMIEPSIRGVNS